MVGYILVYGGLLFLLDRCLDVFGHPVGCLGHPVGCLAGGVSECLLDILWVVLNALFY